MCCFVCIGCEERFVLKNVQAVKSLYGVTVCEIVGAKKVSLVKVKVRVCAYLRVVDASFDGCGVVSMVIWWWWFEVRCRDAVGRWCSDGLGKVHLRRESVLRASGNCGNLGRKGGTPASMCGRWWAAGRRGRG